MSEELREAVEGLIGCFVISGPWTKIRTTDGDYVEVDEDMKAYVQEVKDIMAAEKA